jgi:hypothetical protein
MRSFELGRKLAIDGPARLALASPYLTSERVRRSRTESRTTERRQRPPALPKQKTRRVTIPAAPRARVRIKERGQRCTTPLKGPSLRARL